MSKNSSKPILKISFNSPVVLGFTLICLGAFILNIITGGTTNHLLFSVYRSSMANPLTYFRFFGHAMGHSSWSHFINNITLLLVVGPLLEEKYGSSDMALMMVVTAFVTGLFHFIFMPHAALLGASGIVFAMILLSSFTCVKDGSIPLTFILVAIFYIGGQIYEGFFVHDNVSNITHIIGGVIGAGFGYMANTSFKKKKS